MKKIILDTSFIVSCAEFKIDLFSELKRICNFSYELFIIDKTIYELNQIAKKGGKNKVFVAIAKLFLKKDIKQIKDRSNKSVDDIIIEITNKNDHAVATQDRQLKKTLKNKQVPIISIRQKKYLTLIE